MSSDFSQRRSQLAVLVLATGMTLAGAGERPRLLRRSYDYPWYAARARAPAIPGECAYQTYDQCLASVSGRYLALLAENPRFLFSARNCKLSRGRTVAGTGIGTIGNSRLIRGRSHLA